MIEVIDKIIDEHLASPNKLSGLELSAFTIRLAGLIKQAGIVETQCQRNSRSGARGAAIKRGKAPAEQGERLPTVVELISQKLKIHRKSIHARFALGCKHIGVHSLIEKYSASELLDISARVTNAARDNKRETGYIYFIGYSDVVKIGFALKSAEARISALQTGNPNEFMVYAIVHGTILEEKSLHKRFKHLNIREEWFRAEQEIFDCISKYQVNSLAA